MESEGSLLYSKEPVTGPHIEPFESSPHTRTRSDVLTAVKMSIVVMWVVTPYGVLGG
jgi:hypothetical protein